MGQMTPNGVAELKENPQEPNPAAGIDAQPLLPINEFFNALDSAVQEDPAAEDAANLLIREIQETTGLYTDNPDMQAQASSRMELLNTAIQDSNMPEEIKSSFNNIYTASVDSPQFLNVLNGFISQGGGSISGIAGAAQRLDEERIAKRNDADNRASAAATASMVYDIQKNIQNSLGNFFDRNKEAIAQAASAAVATEKAHGTEAAAQLFADKLTPLQIEELQAFRENNPDATEQDMRQLIDGMLEGSGEQLAAEGASTATVNRAEEIGREQLESQMAQIRQNADKLEQTNKDFTLETRDYASDIMAYFAAGIDFTVDGFNSSQIETKADLNALVDHMFEESSLSIAEQRAGLAELENEYATLNADISSFFGQFQSAVGLNSEEQALLDQMALDIAEQEHIINLREEVNALSRVEVEGLMAQIEDPSDIDVDFLKQAIVNMNPDLASKVQELNDLMGLEQHNPIVQMQALLEDQGLELTDVQRADLENFIEEFTTLQADLAQAEQEFAAQAEAAANMMSPDGILMQSETFGRSAGIISAVADPQMRVDLAYDEMQKAQARMADFVQGEGVAIEQEPEQVAPEPQPEEPSHWETQTDIMAQELAAMETVTRADFEQIMYDNMVIDGMRDGVSPMLEAKLLELVPDFEFAEMSIEDHIIVAFIENQDTLSQQDIELIISEAGIDGAEFQATVDKMIAKYSNHQDFTIDPPVGTAAAQYEQDDPELAANEPAPLPAAQPSEPEPEEQQYANNSIAQNPTLPM